MKRSAFLLGMVILAALTAFAQDEPPCKCQSSQAQDIVCLTQTEMGARAEQIEMQPDRMGNHVNVSGVAVFELIVGKIGKNLDRNSTVEARIASSIHLAHATSAEWRNYLVRSEQSSCSKAHPVPGKLRHCNKLLDTG